MKKTFQRFSKRQPDSFDQVREMTTRKLPVPDLDGTSIYVQFTAEKSKEGYWTISSKTNLKSVTAGLQSVGRAYQDAVTKHFGKRVEQYKGLTLNFDTAFLILRDMEESLLKYNNTPAGEEPPRHYMGAYRLLPLQFREGLDDLGHNRTEKSGPILPPKPGAAPAARQDSPPKNPGKPSLN